MIVLFSPEAEEDFAAVTGYLAERNPVAAADLGRRIFAIIDELAERNFDGPQTVLETGEIVQSWAVPPVRIYYQRHTDTLWVVRIYHNHDRRSPAERSLSPSGP
ncbi:MAG TPA: type II toxin-antitoxin system RelE/ParE family toxin [Kofleriaceae bacterium]|nr:type II toxin-antitoxin system RelE/ParE family toxin [Kofleriaceae bacterium]